MIKFVIPQEYASIIDAASQMPYDGTFEEMITKAKADLITDTTTSEARRILTDSEIDDHRTTYTHIMEVSKIELEKEIAIADTEMAMAKQKCKDLATRLGSMMVEIDDHVKAINLGYVDERLPSEYSFAVCLDGKRLHYTHINGVIMLAKVEPFTAEVGNLFESQVHNQTMFSKMFNLDFEKVVCDLETGEILNE